MFRAKNLAVSSHFCRKANGRVIHYASCSLQPLSISSPLSKYRHFVCMSSRSTQGLLGKMGQQADIHNDSSKFGNSPQLTQRLERMYSKLQNNESASDKDYMSLFKSMLKVQGSVKEDKIHQQMLTEILESLEPKVTNLEKGFKKILEELSAAKVIPDAQKSKILQMTSAQKTEILQMMFGKNQEATLSIIRELRSYFYSTIVITALATIAGVGGAIHLASHEQEKGSTEKGSTKKARAFFR